MSDACTAEADDTQQPQHSSAEHFDATTEETERASSARPRPPPPVFPLAFAERNSRSAPQRRRLAAMRPMMISGPSGDDLKPNAAESSSKLVSRSANSKTYEISGPPVFSQSKMSNNARRRTWFFDDRLNIDSPVEVLSFKPIPTTVRVKDRPRSRTIQFEPSNSALNEQDDDSWNSLRTTPLVTWDSLGLRSDGLVGDCGLTVSRTESLSNCAQISVGFHAARLRCVLVVTVSDAYAN